MGFFNSFFFGASMTLNILLKDGIHHPIAGLFASPLENKMPTRASILSLEIAYGILGIGSAPPTKLRIFFRGFFELYKTSKIIIIHLHWNLLFQDAMILHVRKIAHQSYLD
jgi:hypothetical protein